MNSQNSGFLNELDAAKQRLRKLNAVFDRTRELAEEGKTKDAYFAAFDFAQESELLTLTARMLPAFTGHPLALRMMEEMIDITVPVQIGFTEQGWFVVILPTLLPKKEKGSADYIRGFLYPAMRRFFCGKNPVRYDECVLIYRHIYARDRPERSLRDHDNIELNMVTDIIALYVLKDDHPMRCAHYYCTAIGNSDRTEVYVVPKQEFENWLEFEKNSEDKEVLLYENLS